MCTKSIQLQSILFWCICSILIIHTDSRKLLLFLKKIISFVVAATVADGDDEEGGTGANDILCCLDIVPRRIDYGDRCLFVHLTL